MAQTVKVTIDVREGYAQSSQVIIKQVECKDFEAVARLVGKLLQHLPGANNGTQG